MADFALDTDGDLLIEDGTLQLVTGNDAIAQQVSIRCRFILGEWFLNKLAGIPYFTEIIGSKNNEAAIRGLFRRTIENTQGVQRILTFDLTLDRSTRNLTLTSRVLGTDGHVFDVALQREFVL